MQIFYYPIINAPRGLERHLLFFSQPKGAFLLGGNMPKGIYKHKPLTTEHKSKISVSNKGKRIGFKFSEESKRKMSLAHKGISCGIKNPFFGKHHTEETKEKNRQFHFNGKSRILKKNGYIYVFMPKHPLSTYGRIPEQVFIGEKVLGRQLKRGEIVHHINGVKTDNRKENLLICSSRYHGFLHARLSGLGLRIQSCPQRNVKTGRFERDSKEVRAIGNTLNIPGIRIFAEDKESVKTIK